MSAVPEVRSFFKQTVHIHPHSVESLALHIVGAKHNEPSSPSATPVQIPIVSQDYFSKWVEAVLLYDVMVQQIVKFL